MAGSNQGGTDQSTLEDEATQSQTEDTSDATQDNTAADNASLDLSEDDADGSTQQSIRDMLNEDGGGSVFVNRDLVEPDTIIDE